MVIVVMMKEGAMVVVDGDTYGIMVVEETRLETRMGSWIMVVVVDGDTTVDGDTAMYADPELRI